MNIQLLGTGAGDFRRLDDLADKFAYLPRARELGGPNLRYAAQAMIHPDVLIDFYDSSRLEKFGVATESIRHLFITHSHWDHFQPNRIREFSASLPHELHVYGNHQTIDALKFADTYEFDSSTGRFALRKEHANIAYHLVEPEQTYTIEDFEVAAVHANHGIDKSGNMIMDLNCLNYVFVREGKTVYYGLDASYTFPRTLEYLKRYRFDVAIFDATYGDWPIDVVKSGHHNLAMLAETIGEFRDAGMIDTGTKLIASHIALAQVKPHDDLVDEFTRAGITLAYDGMTIDI